MSDLKSRLKFSKRASNDGAPPPLQAPGTKNVPRRWLLVGGGVIATVLLASTVFGDKPAPRAPVASKKDSETVNVLPANADKAAYEAKFGQDVEALRAEVVSLRAAQAAAERERALARAAGASGATSVPDNITPPPVAPGANTGGLGALSVPPAPPTFKPAPTPAAATPAPAAATGTGASSSPLPPPSVYPVEPRSQAPRTFVAPTIATPVAAATDTTAAKARYRKNANAGEIPAGAFASVALLTGLDAATSTAAQANPQPFLLNVTDHAQLPGAARYKLKNCFVLGTAYGDMSAERVYGRVSRLSCTDKSNRLILSQPVQGYLVDSDNKLGLRGSVSNRQGAKLGSAMLAGFANGLASALGSAQSTVLQNASTGELTSSISGSSALRASGLSGAQSATAQLAEFYLKEAQNIFPVITVDAGRTGTIVFTDSQKLTWNDADSEFVPQITPAQ